MKTSIINGSEVSGLSVAIHSDKLVKKTLKNIKVNLINFSMLVLIIVTSYLLRDFFNFWMLYSNPEK